MSTAASASAERPAPRAGRTPFISCSRCRSRKIKCTGERPRCANCTKRQYDCHYDAFARRRGRDKETGGRLKPKCTSTASTRDTFVPAIPMEAKVITVPHVHMAMYGEEGDCSSHSVSSDPLKQARTEWWLELLSVATRDDITDMCKTLGLFLQSLSHQTLEPHVAAAIMAHATFLKERTRAGQLRSLQFAEHARKMLDVSLELGDTHPSLSQTAVLLAALEFQPHIHQNLARATAALGYIETCAKVCRQPQTTYSTIRREEMRKMCWTLTHLAANVTIWRHLTNRPVLGLSSADPAKFEYLFPQVFALDHHPAARWTSWTLYCHAIRTWHIAVNHAHSLDTTRVRLEVQKLLTMIRQTPTAGTHEYIWQAQEWTIAACGHLGDLDLVDAKGWFGTQMAALARFAVPSALNDEPVRPTYCWWYLMVAYTALKFSEHHNSLRSDADGILEHVYKALDDIIKSWPCSSVSVHRWR